MEAGFSLRVLTVDGVQTDGVGQVIAGLPSPPAAGYLTVNASGENWRVLTEAVPDSEGRDRGWIQAARPLTPTESLLQTLRTQLYLVLPIALVLAALAAYLLTGRTLRPLVTISQVADSIRPGDFGPPHPLPGAERRGGQAGGRLRPHARQGRARVLARETLHVGRLSRTAHSL